MNMFIQQLLAFWNNEEGLTTVEYALAGGLISLSIVLAFTNLSSAIGASIQRVVELISQ